MNAAADRSAMLSFLKETVISLLQTEGISADWNETTKMVDIGVDSVALIHLIVRIEQEYGIFFEDEELNAERLATLASLCEHIESKLNAAS